MVQIQIKKYLLPFASMLIISDCGSPDPKIEQYGLKTLRMIRTYPDNNCIGFMYDLDGDDNTDLVEYRRWIKDGSISAPIRVLYDRNGDKRISMDEIATWRDPLPNSGACPPSKEDLDVVGRR